LEIQYNWAYDNHQNSPDILVTDWLIKQSTYGQMSVCPGVGFLVVQRGNGSLVIFSGHSGQLPGMSTTNKETGKEEKKI